MIAVLAFLRRIPWQVYVILALLSITAVLRWHWIGVGVERCRAAQEAAEKKADVKAEAVAKKSGEEAAKARTDIRKESTDAQSEARVIVRDLGGCPTQPIRLRELGESAVQGARGEMLPAEER